MNHKDVIETTGLMMYNLEIGPYATGNDMNQDVVRYVDKYSIKIAGLIEMAGQECAPCHELVDESTNVQSKEGGERNNMNDTDVSWQEVHNKSRRNVLL